MSAPIYGSCNCGSVTFQVKTELTDIYMCHCSICRKSTGSGGIAVAIVKNEELEWLSGESLAKTWHKPNHDWQTTFCTECGSPLPGKNDDNSTYIPTSLLDTGTEKLKVVHHLYVGSKASWEVISDGGKLHENKFTP